MQNIKSDIDCSMEKTLPPLQHQWSLLGKELFEMEQVLTDTVGVGHRPLSEQEKREQREHIRDTIIAQLYHSEGNYSRDIRHLAFLLLKAGRAGIIVGNPLVLSRGNKQQELPYTGLEGYYAGTQKTARHPGLTPEEILEEEATIGAEVLKTTKKHYIDTNSWAKFAQLRHMLQGGKPSLEELRNIELIWTTVVRRLHVRIYHNPEFEPTLTEQMEKIEQLLSEVRGKTEEDVRLKNDVKTQYEKLKHEYDQLSEEGKAEERELRKSRERIREERLAEFHQFREETYQILTASGQGHYTVGIQDSSLKDATIIETITLPKIPTRDSYPSAVVHFSPEQLEGYLFLAQLGEIGGDPLARSPLVSQ